ncbi:phosphotransferase [Gordonia sp. SID5947]|uniref:phosphotransferase n=1 Tax=Gordonia sp. SID5947 TaxID=2690315 RepID=UPI00136F475B|nr:phosphotransferase [Gordonia sp. SID5947]MYR06849.1 phosphotransferase [Gordonia sp. SID5947]
MTQAPLMIPSDWSDITPEWMSAVLGPNHPGAEVSAVSVQLRDDGTNRRARLGVSYANGTGPASVFAKAVDPEHVVLHKMTSGLFHEPRLFDSGVSLPIETPLVYAALIDADADNFCLVMEDMVARGADMRDATRPMTVEQAANGVRALARLHGRYWGPRIAAESSLGWLEPFETWEGMDAAPIEQAFAYLGDDVPDEVSSLSIGDLIDDIWKPYIRTLTKGPQTLLHGDPHIGNTYVLPDGEVGFLDWQVVRRGNWSLDLGYFLQGALTVDDRRHSERDLLTEYRDALALPESEKPAADEILLGYRTSVAHGLTLWLCTASAGELWQRPDIARALARRYSVAYADLDTREAISELAG